MIRLEKAEDLSRASFVGRTFSLVDVSLAKIEARRSAAIHDLGDEQLTVRHRDSATARVAGDRKSITIHVAFVVTAGAESADEGSRFSERLAVAGTVELLYEKNPVGVEISDEDAATFARISGVHNAWPYVREAVSSLVTRLGYPPLILEPLVFGAQPPQAVQQPPKVDVGSRTSP